MNVVKDVLQRLDLQPNDIFSLGDTSTLYTVDQIGGIRTPDDPDIPTGSWKRTDISVVDLLLNPDRRIIKHPWMPIYGTTYYTVIECNFCTYTWDSDTASCPPRGSFWIIKVINWLNTSIELALYKNGQIFETFEEAKAMRDIKYPWPLTYFRNQLGFRVK